MLVGFLLLLCVCYGKTTIKKNKPDKGPASRESVTFDTDGRVSVTSSRGSRNHRVHEVEWLVASAGKHLLPCLR